MNNEEFYKEIQEQLLEELRLGFTDYHTYDDATYAQVEIDYTTQS